MKYRIGTTVKICEDGDFLGRKFLIVGESPGYWKLRCVFSGQGFECQDLYLPRISVIVGEVNNPFKKIRNLP